MSTFLTSRLSSTVRCPQSKNVATLDQESLRTNCQKSNLWEMKSSHRSIPNLPISIKINHNLSYIDVTKSQKVRCKICDRHRQNSHYVNNRTFHLNLKCLPNTFNNLQMRRNMSTKVNAISHSRPQLNYIDPC